MSDKKSKSGEKRGNVETARRIWLAGIGAYGRAFTEAQEALRDATGETKEIFEDLVLKGEKIETAVSSKRREFMDKAQVPNFDIDDRIAKMRSRLSRGETVAEDLTDMDARLDRIEAKLDAVLKALGKDVGVKSKVKKPSVKKPSVKKPKAKKPTTTRKTAK